MKTGATFLYGQSLKAHASDRSLRNPFKPGMRCRLHLSIASVSEGTRDMDISSQSIVRQVHTYSGLLSPPRPERSGVVSPAVVDSAI